MNRWSIRSQPHAEAFTVQIEPAERRVVLVDNGKPNSMAIMRGAQALLRERGVEVEETIRGKASAGIPMDEDLLQSLGHERGLVLLGVND